MLERPLITNIMQKLPKVVKVRKKRFETKN